MYRSQQLNSEVDGLRSTRALPEARFLPQKDWVASQAPQSETSFVPLTVPPDSMLFASHTTNTIPQPPASFAWKGAEFFVPPVDPREAPISAMSVYARPAPVHIVEHLRTQAVRPATVQYGRTPSAPPRMTVTEQPQWSMESARSSSVTRGDNASRARALSPPRILPSIKYVEPAGAGIQREEVRGSHTIQVPVHKAAPGSVCDVDELYGYFSRGRSKTRRPEASGVAQPSSAPVQVSRAQMPSSGPSQASFASTSPLRSSSPTLSSSHIGSQRALEVANQTIMAAPRSRSPIRRPESPARSPSAPRVDHRQFHKMADEIAFQHIGVGAMMVRNQSPMRSSSPNGRPVSPPATRSVLASPTSIPIQFANKRSVESPQTAPTMTLDVSPQTESMMTRDVSPLRGPQVTANDWVGAAVTYAPSFNYSQSGMVYVPGVASPVNAHFNRVFVPDVSADDDDDWC